MPTVEMMMRSTLLFLLSLLLAAQAWSTSKYDDGDDDEEDEHLMAVRWQLGYELWQRQCEKYDVEDQTEQSLISTRIASGELAEPGMFPYQVALLLQLHQTEGELRQCGGSLISFSYVLTAAHCLIDVTKGWIYLGATSYAIAAEATEVFQVQREDFNIYPDYLGFGGYNDLALIHLPRPATPSVRVQPIPLALPLMQQTLLEGQLVSTSGWGSLGDSMPKLTRIEDANLLHYLDVRVLEQQRCICYFLPGLVSARRHICSDGSDGRGACEGDSGGPLVYQWRNVSYLIGLTTFGAAAGCELGAPTVYTRITAYLEWILSETDVESGAEKAVDSQQSTKCN